jgi:hypothetical protein
MLKVADEDGLTTEAEVSLMKYVKFIALSQ